MEESNYNSNYSDIQNNVKEIIVIDIIFSSECLLWQE